MLSYTKQNIDSSTVIPLVLLHGFLESSIMWDQVQFPVNYPIIKIDLPGHGKSTDPNLLCESISDMAKAAMKVIDKLQIETYHLIGHSMGGYVCLEMKRLDPRSEKIMLLNSNFWADSPEKVKDRERVAKIVQSNKSHFIYEVIPNLFMDPEANDSDVKGLIAEALEISSTSIASASIAMSKRTDHSDFVREHPEDFTVIQGAEDPIVGLGQMRELLEGVKLDYFELEEVGHMAHFEAKRRLNKLVGNFLKYRTEI
ncbi:MAG: alpha/beta fold hydrolase [Crocinitomicaceae bacterium]